MRQLCLGALVCICAVATPASAEDKWTETVAFSRSDASAIKVFEPEGYTASVTIDGQVQSDQAPAVLHVPNADAFYNVTLTAPSGAKWTRKVETKRSYVTEWRVKHVAEGAAQTTQKKYFGKFSASKDMPCAADGSSTKIDFVDGGGTTVATFTAATSGKSFTGQVPDGEYSVRTFRVDTDGTETYRNTSSASIHADGWTALIYCHPSGGGVNVKVTAN